MGAREGIKHFVVLMLENRSFDCLLGNLYPASPSFNGLTGSESNPYLGAAVPVWNSSVIDADAAMIPDPDPGEEFAAMNEQLFGPGATRTAVRPSMMGFAANYMDPSRKTEKLRDPRAVMHYFTPQQLPVLSKLARQFGVCDQWHASAPCQTWPNRLFLYTGTCLGYVNNSEFVTHLKVPFPAESIFSRLSTRKRSWRVYFHDFPHSAVLEEFWRSGALNYRRFGQFIADAHCGALPDFSFIEPHYFPEPLLGLPNDQHPPHNVLLGEKLIADVYNALRASPCWKQSLLVIIYDEHGGCYDHAAPPRAIPPDRHGSSNFYFDHYGVRVPAVIISPYIAPGSIVRSAPAGIAVEAPPYPYDHTSVIRTLRDLFGLGAALTDRDKVAPSLLDALTLPTPANDGPAAISYSAPLIDADRRREHSTAPPNSFQQSLTKLASMIPMRPLGAGAAPQPPIGDSFKTALAAGLHAVARIKASLPIQ